MEFHRVLVQDLIDFLPHLPHGEGSALRVRGQGVGPSGHLGNTNEALTYQLRRAGGPRRSGVSLAYLWSGAAALLEARLATQTAALRRGVMIQTEGGARHDSCLETANERETITQNSPIRRQLTINTQGRVGDL